MSSVNLYDVLNVSQEASRREIKEAYKELAIMYHPDRPKGDPEMFELVTHAYNVLSHTKSRKSYDELYNITKTLDTDHFDLRQQATNYFEAQKTDVTTKKSKKERKKEFRKVSEEMNRKRNFDETDQTKIPEKDALRKLYDIKTIRKQDDIEDTHERIFEEGEWDPERFNRAFEDYHGGPTELIPHAGNPLAWNSLNGRDANYSSLGSYDEIFTENEENYGVDGSLYSGVNFDRKTKKKKITKEHVAKLDGALYYDGHNKIEEDYSKRLEERMREREIFDKTLDEREYDDFEEESKCGGYGIFDDLGISDPRAMTWETDTDIKQKYNKLLEMRKRELVD